MRVAPGKVAPKKVAPETMAARTHRPGTLCIGLLALAFTETAVAGRPTIYRCGGDPAVYSDRPCSDAASLHTTDDSRVTVYKAPPVTEQASPPVQKKSARPRLEASRKAAGHEQRQAKCNKLDQSLRDVRTRMRTGYRVDEGERLKARRRQLTEQRRTEKCR
jgi:hypothetical protein